MYMSKQWQIDEINYHAIDCLEFLGNYSPTEVQILKMEKFLETIGVMEAKRVLKVIVSHQNLY